MPYCNNCGFGARLVDGACDKCHKRPGTLWSFLREVLSDWYTLLVVVVCLVFMVKTLWQGDPRATLMFGGTALLVVLLLKLAMRL